MDNVVGLVGLFLLLLLLSGDEVSLCSPGKKNNVEGIPTEP